MIGRNLSRSDDHSVCPHFRFQFLNIIFGPAHAGAAAHPVRAMSEPEQDFVSLYFDSPGKKRYKSECVICVELI